jgi:hypothetical protein
MDKDQQDRFKQAVERKKAEAKAASQRPRPTGPPPEDPTLGEIQPDLIAHERPPDELSPREKSTRHRKVTADKWNQ